MHLYLFLRWFFLSIIAAAGILLFWVWWLGVFGSFPTPPELPFGWAASHPLFCSRWLDPLLLLWVWVLFWKGLEVSQNPEDRAEVVSAFVVSVVGGICLLMLPEWIGIPITTAAFILAVKECSDENPVFGEIDEDKKRTYKRKGNLLIWGFLIAYNIGYGVLPGTLLFIVAFVLLAAGCLVYEAWCSSQFFLTKWLAGKGLRLTDALTGSWGHKPQTAGKSNNS